MGMQVGGGKKGPMADINVTPFIDVCLVLLIIFMVVVTVEMVMLGYLSKLPPKSQSQAPASSEGQIVIRVVAPCGQGQWMNCAIYINKDLIPNYELVDRIRRIVRGRSQQMIFFTAEDEVNYESAVRILDLVKKSGANNIGVLTEPISVGGTAVQ